MLDSQVKPARLPCQAKGWLTQLVPLRIVHMQVSFSGSFKQQDYSAWSTASLLLYRPAGPSAGLSSAASAGSQADRAKSRQTVHSRLSVRGTTSDSSRRSGSNSN